MSGSIGTSNISFLGIVNAYNNVNTTDLPTTNISMSSFRNKSFTDSTSVPSSGAISINSHFKGKTWGGSGGGGSIAAVLESIRSTMSGFGNTNASSIISTLEGQGYTVFATPKYNSMAEAMSSQSPVTSGGYFYKTYFDNNNTITNSSGFSNSTLNGYPWYGFALYVGSTFKGFGVMMFRDYGSAAVKDFFYPDYWRNLYTWVLNANGTTVEDVGGSTRTRFSNGSGAGSNGYYSSSAFSADDGVWGMCIGRDVDGNSPGPYLSAYSSNSYGFENPNSGDAQSTVYWGGSISSSDYTMYCFTQSGGSIAAVLESIRSTMSGFSNTDASSIISTLEGKGYTVFATPKYNSMAEAMSSQSPVTSGGYFYKTYFDNNNTITNSSGFSNSTLNGYPWYGFALYVGSTFKGFGVMMFRDYGSAAVKDFFYPDQWRNLYTWVLNANGTTIEDVGGSTRTRFSNGSGAGSNGYYSSSAFSADDGVWGMCIGRDVDGNSPGPYLSASSSNSYGFENPNSGDAQSTVYWGGSISSSDYTMYCFTQS